ncbi:MAG TPA: GNAT family N-acetyltransferase [Thermoanaerobaculia bacterium]|nr:GNAT family N-acetyltransferase [Thermoanaerobaculia bacterium]
MTVPATSWRERPAPPAALELWDPWRPPRGGDPERARVRLRDGALLRLRTLRPDDTEVLQRWFDGLSPESRRLRFFGPKHSLAPYEAARLLALDGHWQHAIAALAAPEGAAGDTVAGIVRFVRDREDPRRAEIALGVADAFQSRGLGVLLLDRILAAAACRGVRRVVGEALSENRRVARLVRRVAPAVSGRSLGITREFVIDLERRAEELWSGAGIDGRPS